MFSPTTGNKVSHQIISHVQIFIDLHRSRTKTKSHNFYRRFIHEDKLPLGSFSSNMPIVLDVLEHDGDPLGMDGADICVLEQSNKVSLASLLKSHDGGTLEPQVSLEILSNLSHQTLEWNLAKEEFG